MAETAADKFQSLDIEDTHGDEGVVLASPPSTYEHDESHSKGIPTYGLPSQSTEDDLSPNQTDHLLDDEEFNEYQSKISPLSPDGRKKYGINARNETYRPGGGNVKIFSEKIDFKCVGPRVDARSKSPRKSPPSSIQSPVRQDSRGAPGHSSPSPQSKSIRSKVGSLDNARHTPGGGNPRTKAASSRHLKKTTLSKDSSKKKKTKVKIINRKEKYDAVQSKIGSKDNITHKPGGGNIKIENKRLSFLETAKPKVGSLDKVDHKPGGGDRKITDEKIEWECRAKIGSTANLTHKPGGGDKKILDEKVEWSAQSKIGSKDNITYKPGGGDKRILDAKVEWNVQSKVGSKDNITHKPGGGDKKIMDEKVDWSAQSKIGSKDNITHKPGGGDKKILDEKVEWNAQSKVGSKDNITHKPGGGDKKIEEQKLEWKVEAKVGSKDNLKHSPGGGAVKIESQITEEKAVKSDIESVGNEDHQAVGGTTSPSPPSSPSQIESHKLDFKEKAQPKIGSKDNLDHQPGEGNVQVERQSLNCKENAEPCTDTGVDKS